MSDELADAINDELWRAVKGKTGSRVYCRNLAYTARELEKIADTPKAFLKRAVHRAVRSQGGSTVEAEVAGALLDHAVGDSLALNIPHLTDAVRTIRVTGVWACLQAGLALDGCECFKDLASDKAKTIIKAELEAKIDGCVGV